MFFPGSRRRSFEAGSQWAGRLGLLAEGALLLLLALQLARLVWTLLTPTGPLGDWQARAPTMAGPQARQALFAAFDPFYRMAGSGDGAVQQVTSLPLQLFGIRYNESSGLGSAIIADESGAQRSYAVGDEITPGVKLKAVAYDHVVIDRGGAAETLYIDQSDRIPAALSQAPTASPSQPMASAAAPAASQQITPEALVAALGMAPRLEKGAVTGIVLSAQGDGSILNASGIQPGDIVVQVNGTPIRDASAIASLRNSLVPGARLTLMVERGAATIPVAIILPGKK